MLIIRNASSLLVILIVLGLADSVLGADFVGIPRIIDGDTVQIGNAKIRLQGIDAPETDQICLDANRKRWNCGLEARDRLIAKGGSKLWSCRSSSVDRYGRALASCEADATDLNRWLVRNGWALSFTRYSHDYDVEERVARAEKAGLWSGAFIAPWDWRHRNIETEVLGAVSVPIDAQSLLLATAPDAPSPNCAIKGNVSRNGECIYHLPGGRYYNTVKMEKGKGKRWFCSELEAEAAGCRRSRK
jgi:endonuclease YncB( thermonuclease family)